MGSLFGVRYATGLLVATGLIFLSTQSALAIRELNVKNYGAKGDGVTDDQKALEKAMAAASEEAGTVLVFPAGNFLHSDNLNGVGVTLLGSGSDLSTLTSMNSAAVVKFSGAKTGAGFM